MKFLIDTHTFLWFIEDNNRLPQRARELMEDANNELFLSIASLWEIAIKISIGKLEPYQTFDNIFVQHLERNNIQLLPISVEHLAAVSQLPRHHGDPFDRLLIAQAQVENLSIISADATFDAYAVTRLW